MEIEKKKEFLIKVAFIAVQAVLIWLFCRFLLVCLLSFVIGAGLTMALQKPSRALAKKFRIKTETCTEVLVTSAFIAVIALLVVLIWLAVTGLSKASEILPEFFGTLFSLVKKLEGIMLRLFSDMPESTSQTLYSMLGDALSTLSEKFTAFVSSVATNTVKTLPVFLISSIVTVISGFYIAKDYEHLTRFVRNLIKPETYRNALKIRRIAVEGILHIAIGYLKLMLITFVELLAGFLILGVNKAVGVAAAVAVIDLLPVLGVGTVLIPWAAVSFAGGKAGFALGILLLYTVITIVRNFLEPYIIGNRLGIDPLFTLIAIFVGLRVAGFAGMIILPIVVLVVISYYKEQISEEKDT